MTTAQLEKKILQYTKELPKETLQEVIDFILFLKKKRTSQLTNDDINVELSNLNYSQTEHLESEFKDYKTLYPRE